MNPDNEPYYVIGYVDAYGAIHHEPICMGEEWSKTHELLWPTQTHKRWRFNLSNWQLENSCLSRENLTEIEALDITALMRKHYNPPLWVIEGDEWEALGRPRSGKAYEEHTRKWEKIYADKRKA